MEFRRVLNKSLSALAISLYCIFTLQRSSCAFVIEAAQTNNTIVRNSFFIRVICCKYIYFSVYNVGRRHLFKINPYFYEERGDLMHNSQCIIHNDEITGEVSNLLFFFKTYNNKKVQPFLIGLFLHSKCYDCFQKLFNDFFHCCHFCTKIFTNDFNSVVADFSVYAN